MVPGAGVGEAGLWKYVSLGRLVGFERGNEMGLFYSAYGLGHWCCDL